MILFEGFSVAARLSKLLYSSHEAELWVRMYLPARGLKTHVCIYNDIEYIQYNIQICDMCII